MIDYRKILFALMFMLGLPLDAQAKDLQTYMACVEGIDANIAFIKSTRPDLNAEFIQELKDDLIAQNNIADFYTNSPTRDIVRFSPRAMDNFCVGYDMRAASYLLAKKIADRQIENPIQDTKWCIVSALINAPDIDKLEDAGAYGKAMKNELRNVVNVSNRFYRSAVKRNYVTLEKEAILLFAQTKAKGQLALGQLNKAGLQACERLNATSIFVALDKANGSKLMLESAIGTKPLRVPHGEGFKE